MLFETVALGVCLIFLRRACLSIRFAQLCGCLAARKDGTLKHGPSVGDTVCAKSSSPEALCIFSFVRFVLRIRKDPQRGVKYNWTPGLIPDAFGTFFRAGPEKCWGPVWPGNGRPSTTVRYRGRPCLGSTHFRAMLCVCIRVVRGGSVRLHPGFPFPATCPERSGDSPGWAGDLGPADWGRSRAREESIEGGSFEEERREGSSFDGENIEGGGFQESRLETSSLEGYSFEGGSFEGGSLGRWV